MKLKDCKVGKLVRWVDEKNHRECPQYYPPVGTIGTILEVTEDDILVRWPQDKTADPNEWYCDTHCVEEVQGLLTDGEIWDMLRAKMEKNGVKADCFKSVSNAGFSNLTALNYPLYSKEALIKAVALAYRVGYKRAEKGRPFKYGDNKKNGHWEPVDPNNLPPIGAKLRVAKIIGKIFTNIGDIYYRSVKNASLHDPYRELWVTKEKDDNYSLCSSEHPERFEYWVED